MSHLCETATEVENYVRSGHRQHDRDVVWVTTQVHLACGVPETEAGVLDDWYAVAGALRRSKLDCTIVEELNCFTLERCVAGIEVARLETDYNAPNEFGGALLILNLPTDVLRTQPFDQMGLTGQRQVRRSLA